MFQKIHFSFQWKSIRIIQTFKIPQFQLHFHFSPLDFSPCPTFLFFDFSLLNRSSEENLRR